VLVGDVHHSMVVPEAGGSVLNAEVLTSILNGLVSLEELTHAPGSKYL